MAAGETIMRRMSGFATASQDGRLLDDPELTGMIAEKWIAAAETALAVGPAILAQSPMLAMHPERIADAMANVARATLKPGLKRTRANARRLRRKSGPG